MSGSRNGAIISSLRTLFESGTATGATDLELLDRLADRGPGAEAALSALIDRHGPMVLAVCRRLSGDPSSADDAFQATWLALLRRSGSIRLRGSLAPWLFAVSRRIALRARSRSNRLRPPGSPAPEPIDPSSPADLAERAERHRLLLDEIARLPDRYRSPIVLCHLESRTHDQAASDLGWPVGTVRTRLSRGRRLLRDRLERRGVGLSIAAILATLRREATAAVPSALQAATRSFTLAYAARKIVIGSIPEALALYSYGRIELMIASLKLAAVAASIAGIAGISSGLIGPNLDDTPQLPDSVAHDALEAPAEARSSLPADEIELLTAETPVPGEGANPSKSARPSPALEAALDRKITFNGAWATHMARINQLEAETGIPIVVDPSVFADRVIGSPVPLQLSIMNESRTYTGKQFLENLARHTDLKVRYLDNSIVIDVDERRPEQLTQDNERDVIRSWLYAMQDPLRSLYEQNTYLIRKLRDLEQAESEEEEASPPERKEGVEVTPGDSAVRSSPLPGPVRASTPDSPTSPSFETKQGSPMVSGTEALSDQAVEPAFDSSGSLLDPTIEEVERLFAEKAIEAVEIESALNVWDRLRQVERDDGEPTEIDQFVERTRKTIEARLEDFAGSTDSAPEALERLRSDLKRLMDLHVALVGPEGRSAEVLGTRSVRQFASSLPIESAAERGMLVQKPNDHRVWFFAQRIQSLFSGFDIELGTPVNFGNSNYGFGMMGMGGGMGGGFQ